MICDRCGEETLVYRTSWFNTDKICDTCQTLEEAHPMYEEAKKFETEAVLDGDYNFPGIGLPDDLLVTGDGDG